MGVSIAGQALAVSGSGLPSAVRPVQECVSVCVCVYSGLCVCVCLRLAPKRLTDGKLF